MSSDKKKRAPNVTTLADAQPSACPACGSTNRSRYRGTATTQEYAGIHNGQEYNRIIRRRTQCADCEQLRIDRSYEFEPEKN